MKFRCIKVYKTEHLTINKVYDVIHIDTDPRGVLVNLVDDAGEQKAFDRDQFEPVLTDPPTAVAFAINFLQTLADSDDEFASALIDEGIGTHQYQQMLNTLCTLV